MPPARGNPLCKCICHCGCWYYLCQTRIKRSFPGGILHSLPIPSTPPPFYHGSGCRPSIIIARPRGGASPPHASAIYIHVYSALFLNFNSTDRLPGITYFNISSQHLIQITPADPDTQAICIRRAGLAGLSLTQLLQDWWW